MSGWRSALLAGLLLMGVARLALAQSPIPSPSSPAEPSSRPPANSSETRSAGPSGQRADASGAASTVRLNDADVTATTLGQALDQTPATVLRRSGGLGAPTYLSVRGADPSHVRVILDGIPLHGAQTSVFDLSSIPPELLGRATVYRSNVPVQLGAPMPGGVLHLQTRFQAPDQQRYQLGVGSFATRRVGAAVQARLGTHERPRGELLIAGHYAGSANNFSYFDDRGTPFNRDDDRTQRRRNAGVDAGNLLIRHRIRLGAWRLTSVALGSADHHGLPGLAIAPALETSLTQGRAFAALRAERARWLYDNLDLALLAGASLEFQRYRAPADELGLGAQDQRDRAWLVMLGARPTVHGGPHLTARAAVDYTAEGYRSAPATPAQPTGGAGAPDGAAEHAAYASRNTVAAALEADLRAWNQRLTADVAVRLDASADAAPDQPSAFRAGWSPHAGIALEPFLHAPFKLRAYLTASLAQRLPTFFELYGDTGTTVGNPDLRPEARRGFDTGAQLAGSAEGRARFDLSLTYGYFDRSIQNLIAFIDNGLGVSTPINIGQASIRGHELAAELRIAEGPDARTKLPISLDLSGTIANIDARDRTPGAITIDQPLPSRPRVQFSASGTLNLHWIALRYRLDGNGPATLDQRGRRPIPRRQEHGLALILRPPLAGRPTFSLEVQNLADSRTESVALPDGGSTRNVPRAIADLTGYPLPGRAVYGTITWSPALRR